MSPTDAPVAPAHVCVQFAHAVVEHLAERCGADVLHIKGAAIGPGLNLARRTGSDADVLVRPAHVQRLLTTMTAAGWRVETDFEHGSPFGHASTLLHPEWGYADVHRFFPGVTAPAEDAFDLLWAGRISRAIAGIRCAVPSPEAHSLILVLNAARPGVNATADLQAVWVEADDEHQARLRSLARRLGAEVAFAAAVGELDDFRDRREYDLWRVTSDGGSRLAEWKARIKAAPSRREAVRLTLRAPLVNTEHLAVELGHQPGGGDIARAYLRRARSAARELVDVVARSLRRGGGAP